ncbi:DUF2251 domain-containing protein [Bacillus carboniphilus]|uniref:DUF2251 domain-containing protein n=1 Tax=Bacillus carboniphilus TaxID=86663 RepID=A0ABY9JSB5_9BACI|nr:DUF2251 domain-containing protein [Bacillus carboniphilus]WLR42291.1 DUF2251 domain-containing protein [Bacillus carboniphilus]
MNDQEEGFVIDGISPDGKWLVVFEDNGEPAYLYLYSLTSSGDISGIVDHLWIYNQISPPIDECDQVSIVWSADSMKSIIIVDGECWGMFDLLSMRKLTAPRDQNIIVTIPLEIWEEGIPSQLGETLGVLLH